MEGKYKDCEGIDKEYFPCNVEPCDMQVRLLLKPQLVDRTTDVNVSVVSVDSMQC